MKCRLLIILFFSVLFSIYAYTEIDIPASGKSSLELILNYRDRNLCLSGVTEKPFEALDGTIFAIRARTGATIRIKIQNINTHKYEIKLTDVVSEEKKFEWPAIFAEAFKNLLQPIKEKTSATAQAGLLDTSSGDNLEQFVKNLNKLEVLTDLLSQSEKISKNAADWESLKNQIRKYGKEKLAPYYFDEKEVPDGWIEKPVIEKIFIQAKACVQKMVENRILFEGDLPGDPTMSQKFILSSMKEAEQKALEIENHFSEIKQNFLIYFDPRAGEKQFIFVAPKAYDFKGEKLDLKLEIFDKSDGKTEQSIYRLDFNFSSAHKSYFEVSTGVFFTCVHDASYGLDATPTGPGGAMENHIIRKGAEDLMPFSFGAMIHRGFNISHNWAIALSLGIVIADKSYQIFFGPSIANGKDQRIYVSAGLSAGLVKRLKGHKTNDVFAGQATDIPTETVSRLGFFFGVSYKL